MSDIERSGDGSERSVGLRIFDANVVIRRYNLAVEVVGTRYEVAHFLIKDVDGSTATWTALDQDEVRQLYEALGQWLIMSK